MELLGHIKARASVSGRVAPAPCGRSVGHAGGSVGEVGLAAELQSRKIFRGAQRYGGHQRRSAKCPFACEACVLHRMRTFRT